MTVEGLIKTLAEWSPDTEVKVADHQTDRPELEEKNLEIVGITYDESNTLYLLIEQEEEVW